MGSKQQLKRTPTGAATGSRGERRRARILAALHDCVIKKGYSKTTLKDIASAAGMSASHLLYFFPGKDAILEHYFDKVANLLLTRIEGFRNEPPERQIDLLTDLFFAGKGLTRSEIGFMLECFGAAVHDNTLRQMKTRLDRQCKAYLTDLFESLSGESRRNAKDAAELAYAILIGLRTATYFDSRLQLTQARRLFHDSIARLAKGE
ncbi:MAG: TetR/AcrR family transcriptional regulator [Hyphomicrobiales bacterium]